MEQRSFSIQVRIRLLVFQIPRNVEVAAQRRLVCQSQLPEMTASQAFQPMTHLNDQDKELAPQ